MTSSIITYIECILSSITMIVISIYAHNFSSTSYHSILCIAVMLKPYDCTVLIAAISSKEMLPHLHFFFLKKWYLFFNKMNSTNSDTMQRVYYNCRSTGMPSMKKKSHTSSTAENINHSGILETRICVLIFQNIVFYRLTRLEPKMENSNQVVASL